MKIFTSMLILFFLIIGSSLTQAEKTADYYSTAHEKTGKQLKTALHDIIKVQKVLSYGQVWDALKTTDEDPNNSSNVILLYSGWSYPKSSKGGGSTQWNREHTWAKSYGDFGTSNGPGTDIHHLRPTDVTVNSKRGNLYFDDGGSEYIDRSRNGGGNGATGCKYNGNSWEPRDEVKGDVARMLFYMAVRYESEDRVDLVLSEYSSGDGHHGKLSTLLKWHKNDPVSDWEISRNNKIFNIQENRNPFIDHPEYAELIWGERSDIHDEEEEEEEEEDNTSSVLFFEDFENTELGEMTQYSADGDDQYWYQSSHNGNNFAKMSGYKDGNNYNNEDWLINKNAINLNGFMEVKLSFLSMMKAYGDETTLKIFISDNYDGTSDPSSFNWTEITSQASFSTGNYTPVSSGLIDLTNWETKSIYIAFKFESTNRGSNTWNIDDIKVTGKLPNSIDKIGSNQFSIFPNPCSNFIKVKNTSSIIIKSIEILDFKGDLKHEVSNHTNTPISIDHLSSGVYMIKFTDVNSTTYIKKFVKK